MSANTETTGGPPKGYVECPKKCGRWKANRGQIMCWRCFFPNDSAEALAVYDRAGCGDWTPPIAAPAAHVERRKGQRWRISWGLSSVREDVLTEQTTTGWSTVGPGGFSNACWTDTKTYTATLLADAAPEPAECGYPIGSDQDPCNLNKGHLGRHSLNRVVVAPPAQEAPVTIACAKACGRYTVNDARAMSWTCKQCSTQEAPKAAPVCAGQGKLHHGAALERYVKNIGTGYVEHRRLCDACHLWHEKQFIELTAPRSTGKPYAGPERLPRPQLAADWVEDCLPESDR